MTKKGNTNKSRGQLSHVGMPMDIHIIAHTYRLGVTDGKTNIPFYYTLTMSFGVDFIP